MAEEEATPPFSFLRQFASNTELLSYLILCVAKMPFIPPAAGSVARPRSVSVPEPRRTGGGGASSVATPTELGGGASSVATPAEIPPPEEEEEDKASSVKERLASNLKQLAGRRSQARSRLPTVVERRNPWLRSPRLPRLPGAVSSRGGGGGFPARTQQAESRPGREEEKEEKEEKEEEKEARFTLTLTPEAVVVLRRRSAERQRAARTGGADTGGAGRRRDNNVSRRVGHNAGSSSSSCAVPPGNIGSAVKISLLNERHRYDDVEYEEEGEGEGGRRGADERVVLKCTEWLRGLESEPVTLRRAADKRAGLKSF